MADTTSTGVHPVSRSGFGSKETGALEAYEAARPSYPDEALLYCAESLGLLLPAVAAADAGATAVAAADGFHTPPPPQQQQQQQQQRRKPRVLDLAAGTGKLTRRLVDLNVFGDVSAAEPSEGMLEGLARLCPDVPAARAEAAALPYDAGAFDAVVVGQAFHWFANEAAAREIWRVLRPAAGGAGGACGAGGASGGGGLALLWNMEDGREAWMRELMDILRPLAEEAAVPSYVRLLDLCKGFAPQLDAVNSAWFAQLFDVGPGGPAARSRLFPWKRPVARSAVWLRVLSTSFVATLPEVRREEVKAQVEAWVKRHEGRFVAREDGGEPVAMFDMVTEAFVVRKR